MVCGAGPGSVWHVQGGVGAMRLSDSEQRLLAELELALRRDGPRYVHRFTRLCVAMPRSRWRRVLRLLLPWRY
jgi:hypothetical protein